MIPQTIKNIAFTSYELKAEYLLTNYNLDNSIKSLMSKTEGMYKPTLPGHPPAISYINKLKYLQSVDFSELVNFDDLTNNYMSNLAKRIMTIFVNYKKTFFESELFRIYQIRYSDVSFDGNYAIHDKLNVSNEKVNEFEGFIYFSHFKDLIANKKMLNMFIDYIGSFVER